MSMLKYLAGGAASGLAGGLIGLVGSSYAQKQQKELMDKSFDQAQAAERNSFSNQKEGLSRAGMSTALLNGSSANVASGTAPSAPSNSIPSSAFSAMSAFKDIALMDAQKDLLNANANKSNADANYTNGAKTSNTEANTRLLETNNAYQTIIVDRENDKDANSAKALLKLMPDECKKLMEEKNWTEKQFIENATIGIIDGLTYTSERNRDAEKARFEFAEAQVKNSDVYLNAISVLPYAQVKQIDSVIENLSHNDKFLDSMAELNRSNTALNDNERKAVLQQQNKMIQQAIKESAKRIGLMDAQKVKTYVNTATDVVNTTMNVVSKGLSGSPSPSPDPEPSPYLPGSPTFRNYGFPGQD